MHVLALFFAWPLGFVWGNLVASAITTGIVMIRMNAQKKLHVRHHEELKELHIAHHEAHMEAISQVTGTVSPDTLGKGGDLW